MLKTIVETKLETRSETMMNSSSCRFSSVYGRQTLETGEEAFCDNGWTVNSSLILLNFVLTNLIMRFLAEKLHALVGLIIRSRINSEKNIREVSVRKLS